MTDRYEIDLLMVLSRATDLLAAGDEDAAFTYLRAARYAVALAASGSDPRTLDGLPFLDLPFVSLREETAA